MHLCFSISKLINVLNYFETKNKIVRHTQVKQNTEI
jgi:hypothetical protein